MDELDLKELLMLFWNKKLRILLIVAIFVLVGVIYTIGFVTPMYTSSTQILLATSDTASSSSTITTTDITLNSNLVSTYGVLVKSKSVIRQVITNLGIDMKEEELEKHISVNSVKNTQVIEISVTDRYATNAAKIANEIAEVFTDTVQEYYKINNVHVVDKAEVEEEPSNINHLRDMAIFTFIGLIVAVMYVLVGNMLDTTIKTAEDVEKQFKVPVLASIPMYSFDLEKGGKKK